MADDSCVEFKRTIAEVEESSKESLVIVVSSANEEREIAQTSPKTVKSSSFESLSNSKDTQEHIEVDLVSVSENDQEMLSYGSLNVRDYGARVEKGDILDAGCKNFVEIVNEINTSQKDCENNFECVQEFDENENRVGELEMDSVIEGSNGINSSLCFDVNNKNEPIELENALEAKKKQLLAQIELGSVFRDKTCVNKVTGFSNHSEIDGNGANESDRTSLKFKVIDDTAFMDTVILPRAENGHVKGPDGIDFAKTGNNNEKAKQSRRSKAREAKRQLETRHVHQNFVRFQNDDNQTKSMYSKEKMLGLRFVNVVDQREKWRSMYTDLSPDVAKEYDSLVASKKHKNANFTPGTKFGKKGDVNEIRKMRDGEMDPTCGGHKEVNENRESECSDDYDSDYDDYHYDSIQRPALYVEGEPDFESGPPEDGLEYLRRVRWEAARIPKVNVAKIDKSRLKHEQSVYMPQIPEIAKCPEHLQPLKQWEDQFLADFSSLRLVLSSLCDSGEVQSMSILYEEKPRCQIPENILEKFKYLATVDPHSSGSEQSSTSNPEIIKNQSSSDETCPDYPPLSAITKMSPVNRVSMLRKRINSLETTTTLSKSDCAWLFSLCAAVDTPLDADTSASIRSLLRKCASLRADKSELDDETVMLNILATIAGRYFGQSEC